VVKIKPFKENMTILEALKEKILEEEG